MESTQLENLEKCWALNPRSLASLECVADRTLAKLADPRKAKDALRWSLWPEGDRRLFHLRWVAEKRGLTHLLPEWLRTAEEPDWTREALNEEARLLGYDSVDAALGALRELRREKRKGRAAELTA